MSRCDCDEPHEKKRVVLTGGPGAGKTAVLELFRRCCCPHLLVLPEAATIIFGGGFPRGAQPYQRRAAQRAIFHVQRELEVATPQDAAILLCDRGTIDGAAYWPGPEDLFSGVGVERSAELLRYSAVIHLRTPVTGYNHQNPVRIESASEAAHIDELIAQAWEGHPRRFFVDAEPDFLAKARRALALLRDELPECCRRHVAASEGA